MSNSSIGPNTRLIIVDAGGQWEVPIRELDEDDLNQLSLVAAAEAREQYPMPIPIAAIALAQEVAGSTDECSCGKATIVLFDYEAQRNQLFHRSGGRACAVAVSS